VKRPTVRGCAQALVAVAVVTAAVSVPCVLGEISGALRVETTISSIPSARLEPSPSPSPERRRWLRELERHLAERMPAVAQSDRTRLADVIYDEAKSASLDPLLVLAVIAVESGFDHDAESGRGAVGLMQLRPETLRREAERAGLDPEDAEDPALNVRAGVRYFRRLLRAFGSIDVALMAYNAGPNRILRYLQEEGAIPERFLVYPERVAGELRRLRRGRAPTEFTFVERQRRAKALASTAPFAGPPEPATPDEAAAPAEAAAAGEVAAPDEPVGPAEPAEAPPTAVR
jgi:soluble lytic murein transglycosylase-like protein